MADPTATGTLKVTKPGPEADKIVAAVSDLVEVTPAKAPDTYRLAFHHARPRDAHGVLIAHLGQSRIKNWEQHVRVAIDGAKDWRLPL